MGEKPVDELEGRELDREVARHFDMTDPDVSTDEDSPGPCPTCGYHGYYAALPYLSKNIAAAWLVEEQIDQRGLYDEYAEALLAALVPDQARTLLGVVDILPYDDLFRLVHATPTERCRAALKAVRNA